jgi:hypothetical protein
VLRERCRCRQQIDLLRQSAAGNNAGGPALPSISAGSRECTKRVQPVALVRSAHEVESLNRRCRLRPQSILLHVRGPFARRPRDRERYLGARLKNLSRAHPFSFRTRKYL